MKSCPWCGGYPIMTTTEIHGYSGCYFFEMKCRSCGATAPDGKFDTVYHDTHTAFEAAVAKWNKRADNEERKTLS